MASTAYNKFKKLEKQIQDTAGLKDNPAVKQSLSEINKEFDKDQNTKYFDTAEDVFDAIGSGISKFMKTDANGADIASGILEISSAIFTALKLLPGAEIITGGLAIVLKLFGSIAGHFGGTTTTRYYNALKTMVNDAVDRVNTEAVIQNLDGTMSLLHERQTKVAHLLSLKYDDPQKELSVYASEITTSYFSEIGEKELGVAYSNISGNTGRSHRHNWPNTAETFYSISELVSFKHLFLLQGMAYFQLAEGSESLSSKYATVTFSTKSFMDTYYKLSLPYFGRPTLVTAAITHYIYRMSEEKFSFLAQLYNTLSDNTAKYWPTDASNYEFNCSIADRHDTGAGNTPQCIRLTTLFAHRESSADKNRVLKNPDTKKSNGDNIKADHSVGRPAFISKKDGMEKAQCTHFGLWPKPNGAYNGLPHYSWHLEARNKHSEYYIKRNPSPAGKHIYKSFIFSEDGVYIFQVFPTEAEIASGKGLWEAGWKKKPENGRTYVMIGSRGGDQDQVWATRHKKNTGSTDYCTSLPYYDIVYNDHDTYGNPDHCMWYLLSEGEW